MTPFIHKLLALLLIMHPAAFCCAQLTSPSLGDVSSRQLPRLCQSVSYREPYPNVRFGTRVSMLGDRYLELSEALTGWNEAGVALVGKHKGKWEPVPCGDDTGLFYLVPLLARQTGLSLDRALDLFLLGTLAGSAALGAVGVWLTVSGTWQRCLAFVPIALSLRLAFRIGDVYLVQASVVLLLLPWLLYVLKDGLAAWLRYSICFSCGVSLGLAQWIRTQAASPLLVFFAVLVYFSPLRRSTRLVLSGALIGGMCVPLLFSQFPLHRRDRFLALQQRDHAPLNHHVFWHTAYLGLAYLTNPYVPAWRDADAVAYVESVDANAIYGSPEYESILRFRVLQIAGHDYRFIFDTVAAKLGVLACLLLLFTNVGLLGSYFSRKPSGEESAFWLAMAVAALPGIVAIPAPQYVAGMLVLALYYWFYSVSRFLSSANIMQQDGSRLRTLLEPR